MIIQWDGGRNFSIKTKALIAKIGEKNKLGDLEIVSPGEYEVSGIQMEIIDGIIEIFAEGIAVGHIRKAKVLSDDDLQKLNGIDILLIGVGGGEFTDTKIAQEVINQIEPSIVIPMYSGSLDDFGKAESAGEPIPELKISKIELTDEERKTVVLTPSK
jgi:hypothetical protein